MLASTETAIALAIGVCSCDEEEGQALNETSEARRDGLVEHCIEIMYVPETFNSKAPLGLFFAFVQQLIYLPISRQGTFALVIVGVVTHGVVTV